MTYNVMQRFNDDQLDDRPPTQELSSDGYPYRAIVEIYSYGMDRWMARLSCTHVRRMSGIAVEQDVTSLVCKQCRKAQAHVK